MKTSFPEERLALRLRLQMQRQVVFQQVFPASGEGAEASGIFYPQGYPRSLTMRLLTQKPGLEFLVTEILPLVIRMVINNTRFKF